MKMKRWDSAPWSDVKPKSKQQINPKQYLCMIHLLH